MNKGKSEYLNYEQALFEVVKEDPHFVVMTAENHASIRNLPALLANCFIDTGINEQTLVGAAAGMALRGSIPVVHAIASFLTMRAYEFIRTDIGIAGLPVKLVGSIAGFLSTSNGLTHQAIEDLALMSAIPSIQIFCPADEEDLTIGLEKMLTNSHPVYIRLNQQPSTIRHDDLFIPGKAEKVFEGNDLAILTYGLAFGNSLEATRELQKSGLKVRLLNMRTLNPIDLDAIISAAMSTNLLVTIEDHLKHGGLATKVKEILIDYSVQNRVLTLALEGCFEPGTLEEIMAREGYTGSAIAQKIIKAYWGG
jgi:transketolase